jgi:hypothetical protein
MTRAGLNQPVTYWAPSGSDGRYGKTGLNAPVTLKGHWEDRAEEFVDVSGNTSISKSVIYIDGTVQIQGYLFQGTSVATTPPSDAQEIRQVVRTPSMRSLEGLTEAIT